MHAGAQEVNYAFVYPNLMVNRYGSWMDTNVVEPLGSSRCLVRFDWWVEGHMHDQAAIDAGIASSDRVRPPAGYVQTAPVV